jgi:hypothetical protein
VAHALCYARHCSKVCRTDWEAQLGAAREQGVAAQGVSLGIPQPQLVQGVAVHAARAAGEHAPVSGGRDVRQEAQEGWAAESMGAEVTGRFRSP